MPLFQKRGSAATLALAATITAVVSVQSADAGVTMTVNVDGFGDTFGPNGIVPLQTPGAVIDKYNPDHSVAGLYNMWGDVNVIHAGNMQGMALPLNVENLSNQVLKFTITITADLTFLPTGGLSWVDSSSFNLGGAANAELMTHGFFNPGPDGPSLWQAYVDGVQVDDHFDDPSGMGGGGGDLSEPNHVGVVGGVNNSISIQLAFLLSPGAIGGTSGQFQLTPAPGSLALLAGAGLIGRRRRRN